MSEPLWQLRDVRLGGGVQPRLNDLRAAIAPGVTAIIGASGSGKTSLLNLLVGFEKPQRGTVECSIRPAPGRLPFFWAPQDFGLWPHLGVAEHLGAVMPRRDDVRIRQLLGDFDLLDKAAAHPAELSQGQRARLSIARALAAEPMVLVMDEPLAHVDPSRVDRYWSVIDREIAAGAMSLVFAAHDPAAVMSRAERALCLDAGRVLYDGDCRSLYWRPASEPLMHFLGHGNWFESDEARRWLGGNGIEPCIRPEQIAIDPGDDASPLLVCSARFAGPVAEAELLHEPSGATRRVFHRPANHALHSGQRVVLRLLTLLLLAAMASLFTACGEDTHAAPLNPVEIRHWRVPPDGPLNPAPRHVSIGPDDQVLALDDDGRVLIYDAEGSLLRWWRMPDSEAGHPEGACWLKDGRIAVADTHYYQVVIFDDQGQVLAIWGQGRVTAPGGFIYPVSIEQDDDENIYVAEYGGNDRIQKFTPDGQLLLSIGASGSGPGQLQRTAGIVWHEGRLYVADAANHRVQVFTDTGAFVATLAEGELRYPYDVDVGPGGDLYAIEWLGGRVTRMSLEGRLLGRFGRTGSGVDEFLRPWSVAVDSRGRIRVADRDNRRIVALRF